MNYRQYLLCKRAFDVNTVLNQATKEYNAANKYVVAPNNNSKWAVGTVAKNLMKGNTPITVNDVGSNVMNNYLKDKLGWKYTEPMRGYKIYNHVSDAINNVNSGDVNKIGNSVSALSQDGIGLWTTYAPIAQKYEWGQRLLGTNPASTVSNTMGWGLLGLNIAKQMDDMVVGNADQNAVFNKTQDQMSERVSDKVRKEHPELYDEKGNPTFQALQKENEELASWSNLFKTTAQQYYNTRENGLENMGAIDAGVDTIEGLKNMPHQLYLEMHPDEARKEMDKNIANERLLQQARADSNKMVFRNSPQWKDMQARLSYLDPASRRKIMAYTAINQNKNNQQVSGAKTQAMRGGELLPYEQRKTQNLNNIQNVLDYNKWMTPGNYTSQDLQKSEEDLGLNGMNYMHEAYDNLVPQNTQAAINNRMQQNANYGGYEYGPKADPYRVTGPQFNAMTFRQ